MKHVKHFINYFNQDLIFLPFFASVLSLLFVFPSSVASGDLPKLVFSVPGYSKKYKQQVAYEKNMANLIPVRKDAVSIMTVVIATGT